MGLLRNVVAGVLIISCITFVALFGRLPALRKTPVGWLQRLLCLHLPNGLKYIDTVVTGGRLTRNSRRLGRYLFHEKNPVVLILFISLLTGCAILFLWNAFHRLTVALQLPIPLVVILPYIFTYLSVSARAHYITSANHGIHMAAVPYDQVLFHPNNVCSTCDLVKPARSKHCSFCGHCIAQCDHHCPWINNCVGRGNYRWFLALLLSLGVVEIYGAYLSWYILRPNFHLNSTNPLLSYARMEDIGHAIVIAINYGGLSIAGVGLLAVSTASLPLGLLAYHLYLIWAGMTTNESQKWGDWREDMADGYVFRALRSNLRAHNQSRKGYSNRAQNLALDSFDDEGGLRSRWPVTTEWVLVRTNDGKPPVGQEALWEHVWSLNDVDNIYDLGARENFREMLLGR